MKRNPQEAAAKIDCLCGKMSRRNFLRGSGVAAGAAAVNLTFSPNAHASAPTKSLIYLFLRGGMDGLSFVVPTGGADLGHYLDARNDTELRLDSQDAARRPIALPGGLWGLHQRATGLKQVFDANKLAIIHAAGHLDPDDYTRSHFDAQEQIEMGTPGVQTSQTGWLARHLLSTPLLQGDAVFTALVSSSNPPASIAGWSDVATLDSTNSFHPNPNGAYARTHLATLRNLYPGTGDLDMAARSAVDAVDLISSLNLGSYVPGGGVTYPQTGLGNRLRLIAQLMRQNIGIAVATVDYGGWDTHNEQFGGYANSVQELSDALRAFYFDLAGAGRAGDATVIVQSEFGRQVTENADRGTDHGLANPMLVMGGNVIGGLYGNFPGLATGQRVGDAVRPTTDFRQVIATAVDRLLDNPNVGDVFDEPQSPFTYAPMGFAAP
jgi:uncharacterized protein (DUF1501 family)